MTIIMSLSPYLIQILCLFDTFLIVSFLKDWDIGDGEAFLGWACHTCLGRGMVEEGKEKDRLRLIIVWGCLPILPADGQTTPTTTTHLPPSLSPPPPLSLSSSSMFHF